MNKHLLQLLALIGTSKYVYWSPSQNTYDQYVQPAPSLTSEKHTIASRIQYELYGEYPLSPANQVQWDTKIKKAFKGI